MFGRRGFTLIEIIVSSALAALVLTMVVAFLVPSLRASGRSRVQIEMQQQAMIVFNHLASDLEKSAPAGLTLDTSPGATRLGIMTVDGVDDAGTLAWELQLLVYTWDSTSRRLEKRYANPVNAPDLLKRLDGLRPLQFKDELHDLAAANGIPKRILASGVTSMAAVTSGSTVRIDVVLQRSEAQSAQSYTQSRTFSLRNR